MDIRVNAFGGTTNELSEFVVSTWLASYEGHMIVPQWTSQYFDWMFPTSAEPGIQRCFLVAAWDGNRLIGVVVAMPYDIQVHGETIPGTQASWLSVLPEYRRHGVARKMTDHLTEVERNAGRDFRIGYMYLGFKESLGPKFWLRRERKTHFSRKLFLWLRIFNPRIVGRWRTNTIEKFGLRLLPSAFCRPGPVNPRITVRPYVPGDLAACIELANEQSTQVDLGLRWSNETLGKHLYFPGMAYTFVLERSGSIVGFLNFHVLALLLLGTAQAAIIDLLICRRLTHEEIRTMINHCLRSMESMGCDLVLMREFAKQPTTSLLRIGFVPQLTDSQLIFHRSVTGLDATYPNFKTIHVLWR